MPSPHETEHGPHAFASVQTGHRGGAVWHLCFRSNSPLPAAEAVDLAHLVRKQMPAGRMKAQIMRYHATSTLSAIYSNEGNAQQPWYRVDGQSAEISVASVMSWFVLTTAQIAARVWIPASFPGLHVTCSGRVATFRVSHSARRVESR
jgi:hypothetical protein